MKMNCEPEIEVIECNFRAVKQHTGYVVECRTQEQYDELMDLLGIDGFHWRNNQNAKAKGYWDEYLDRTGVCVLNTRLQLQGDDWHTLGYSDIAYWRNTGKRIISLDVFKLLRETDAWKDFLATGRPL